MPGLCDLPDEVILLILKSGVLYRAADFAALTRSCKRLKDVAEDTLYTRSRDRDGSSAIRWAAEHGNTATLEKASKYGLTINEDDSVFTPVLSPFHIAVVHGQDSAVAWFLDHGVDIAQQVRPRCDCRWDSACILHVALCLGHASTAQLLISRGAPLEYTSYDFVKMDNKTSALHEAAQKGLVTIVETLVKDYGMNLHTRFDPLYRDALACAAMSDDSSSMIRTLVGLGADVNGSHQEWHSSPLHVALGEGNFAAAHTLLDLNARIHSYEYDVDNVSDSKGEEDEEKIGFETIFVDVTPLHDAIASIAAGPTRWDFDEKWKAERASFMKRLIELGVDVNMESVGYSEDATPLDIANEVGEIQDMTMLIAAGAKVHSRMLLDAWRNSESDPREGTTKIKLLLKHGARLDEPVEHGMSTLQVVAEHADAASSESGLHEILLSSSPKSLSSDHLNQVLAECLGNLNWFASIVLIRHGARVSCEDELFSIASRIAEKLKFEKRSVDWLDFDQDSPVFTTDSDNCIGFIIDMGLSSADQCLIFQDILRKRKLRLAHLFLDRGLGRRPEAAEFLPAYLMLAASWGNVCVIKRLWQYAHEALDPTLRLWIVQHAIIPGNREAVSFLMEHGATPFQYFTPAQVFQERQMGKEALLAAIAALERLKSYEEVHLAGPCVKREVLRTQILAQGHELSGYADTCLRPLLSPLQLAVRCGHIDIVSDLLEHITQADAGVIIQCGKIYIPCVLEKANEIKEMIEQVEGLAYESSQLRLG